MTNQPTPDPELIRAAVADAVQVCTGPLADHITAGVLYALGHTDMPPADGAPGPAVEEPTPADEAAEDRRYWTDRYDPPAG